MIPPNGTNGIPCRIIYAGDSQMKKLYLYLGDAKRKVLRREDLEKVIRECFAAGREGRYVHAINLQKGLTFCLEIEHDETPPTEPTAPEAEPVPEPESDEADGQSSKP